MYDFMTATVIITIFLLIITLDIYGLIYLITSFIKWMNDKVHKKKDVLAREPETQDTK